LQNDHRNMSLMDRNLFYHFISKKGPKFRYFAYLEGIYNFYFSCRFDAFCLWIDSTESFW